MIEEIPDWPEAQCLELQRRLEILDTKDLIRSLAGARLDLLSFTAGGAGMVRRVLVIEQASRELVDYFPLQDPTAIEDASTVRASTLRAIDQLNRVLALIGGWLESAPADPNLIAQDIRSLLHALNNVLVGITCYAELLAGELQAGDPCHDALLTIVREGAAISRLVRDRTGLQPYLNALFEAPPSQAPALERQALTQLLSSFGIQTDVNDQGKVQTESLQISHALRGLPPTESKVMQEALRRLATVTG